MESVKEKSDDQLIKVMYLDPVGFSSYDQVFADMAKRYKYDQTEVDVASLDPKLVPPKMTDLEFRSYEALIVAETVKAARYASENGYDALAIGCFYDPALPDAREIAGVMPVVGPCQSACQVATVLAERFSVIVGEQKWVNQMRSTIYNYGYRDKLASFEAVGLRVEDFHKDPEKTKSLLKAAAVSAIEKSYAECIVLGCTLEVGFYEDLIFFLAERYGANIPVIDASIVVLKAAEHAGLQAKIGWQGSTIYGQARPSDDELRNFGIYQPPYCTFGNIINVPAINPSSQKTLK